MHQLITFDKLQSFQQIVMFLVNYCHQNYYQSQMEHFAKIFSKRLQIDANSNTPVVCSVVNWYENAAQRQLMKSAYERKEAVFNKNSAVAEASLKYRNELQEKLDLMQKKHQKNRKEHLNKIKKTEERKIKYVQEIGIKNAENQKSKNKERILSFRQNQEKMEQFWSKQKIKRELSYSEQAAVKPLYEKSVGRKKRLQESEEEQGLRVKSQLLKKHQNRQQLVYKQVEKKRAQVHQVHKQQIEKNLTKHQEIMSTRVQKIINDIGNQFAESQEVLLKKKKQLEKKLKDKRFDEFANMETVRSNFMERYRNRSATLSSCRCKRINNVEQGITTSVALIQKQRHLHFTQTLRQHQKNPSEVVHNRNNFIVRSHSMRSTVSKNQDTFRQRVEAINTERLKRQKIIAQAIALKKSIQVQGNCHVRLANVK